MPSELAGDQKSESIAIDGGFSKQATAPVFGVCFNMVGVKLICMSAAFVDTEIQGV
jgi:hypothetical protein